jgi:hypothetical protein
VNPYEEHKWRYMFGVNENAQDGCLDPKNDNGYVGRKLGSHVDLGWQTCAI